MNDKTNLLEVLGITTEDRIRDSVITDLANAMPQIVWTAEPDGTKDYYNRHWFKYTGLNAEQSQESNWKLAIHPDDRKQCIKKWNNACTTGESYEAEYRLRAADGSYHWYKSVGHPVRDYSGKIIKWFGTCVDIEDQRQAFKIIMSNIEALQLRIIELEDQNKRLKSTAFAKSLSKMKAANNINLAH